jgi:hypothetical protein
MGKIQWRRGLVRLWIVLSALWLMVATYREVITLSPYFNNAIPSSKVLLDRFSDAKRSLTDPKDPFSKFMASDPLSPDTVSFEPEDIVDKPGDVLWKMTITIPPYRTLTVDRITNDADVGQLQNTIQTHFASERGDKEVRALFIVIAPPLALFILGFIGRWILVGFGKSE